MNIKHETAIVCLFAALKDGSPKGRTSLYWSLLVLVEDLDDFFDKETSNAEYMKEKATLFIEACKIVAGLAKPQVSFEHSIAYAEGNLLKLRSMAQGK